MKIKIVVTAAVVLAVLMIGSCSMFFGMSIESRITQFQMDLNTDDRANIQDNFSSSCQNYNEMNTESYWNSNSVFEVDNRPFVISIAEVDGETATGIITYNGISPSIEFVMENGGLMEGWKITEIWINGSQEI